MLPLLLALTVAQAPREARGPVAVVPSSKRAHVERIAPKIASRVQAALTNEGVDSPIDAADAAAKLKALGYSDPRNCQAATACLARLAKLLGPRAIVVGVDTGKIARSLAVHLEAVAADTGEAIASTDVSASIDRWPEQVASPLSEFARKVADEALPVLAKEEPPPIVAAPDAPVQPKLEPKNPEPSPVVVAEPVHRGPGLAPWALAGTSVVALGTAAAFGALGLQDKRDVEQSRYTMGDGQVASRMTQDQLETTQARGNLRFTVAMGSAAVGVALAAASTYLFARSE